MTLVDTETVTKLVAQIPGFSSSALCAELMKHAANVPRDRAIIEIGVYYGRTACHLGLAVAGGGGAHVWAIDPWDLPGERYPTHWLYEPGMGHRHNFTKTETREAAERNVRVYGLTDHITLVRDFGSVVGRDWTGPPVGMLFVDGDHRREFVIADVEAWRPHLVPGAVVAFDDYDRSTHPDVPAVVDDYCARGVLVDCRLTAGRLLVARYAG
jgi:predicted O-methyltransferase YrrM